MFIRFLTFVFSALILAAESAPLSYLPVQSANPLKGFLPYDGNHGPDALPHSMEFIYLPLKELMNGPDSFTWPPLDAKLDQIAGRGHQCVLRLYLDYPGNEPGIPAFLRNGPDGNPGTGDDLVMNPYNDHGNNGISLSPDYSNPQLRAALQSFIAALGARYDGDPRIGFIQMGLLGFWGEWHTFPYDWMPSLAVQQDILAAFDNAFNQTRLLLREPKDASFQNYAMGYHDDSFTFSTLAPPAWHFSGRLATHGESDRWKTQPIGGEIRPEHQPALWENPASIPSDQAYDLCVAAIHPSWMLAHGAFSNTLSPAARQLAETQSRMLGYEFHLPQATITAGSILQPVTVATALRNTGIAPFYHDWALELAVLNAANQIIHTSSPAWSVKDLLPGSPDRAWSHSIPAGAVPDGTHKLLLRVVNPLPAGIPLRFANTTQDADLPGWLTLGSFTVQAHQQPSSFKTGDYVPSGGFDAESHPDDPDKIRSEYGEIHYITHDTWAAFENFNFGTGATYFEIHAATPNAGSAIEVWRRSDGAPLSDGPLGGELLGTIPVTPTGDFNTFQPFSFNLPAPVAGAGNLYLRFTGGGGSLLDVASFRFLEIAPGLKRAGSSYPSGAFDSDSDPGGTPVQSAGDSLGYIVDGTWAAYTGFDFGEEANTFTIEGASPAKGGSVEIRTDSPQGPLLGTVIIAHTGSWTHFRPFSCVLSTSVSGVHDLYLRFVDSNLATGYLFDTRRFVIGREVPELSFPLPADSDGDNAWNLLEYACGMHPGSKDKIPLKLALDDPAAPSGRHDIEVRLRADDSLVEKLLVSGDLASWEPVTLLHTDGVWQTDHPYVTVSQALPTGDGLFHVRLDDSRTATRLFVRLSAATAEGGLHVYPPVPGLAPSPYYEFSVQKVSALNAAEKHNATNWLHPFAWFTRCVDYDPGATTNTAYYSPYIGGWSHTYCNFELDPHTPVVIKIRRLDKTGAPSGPITSAAVHPAHKVDSWEIINGEVYVTMSRPELVAIDIDGQLDSRDAPRALPTGWGNDAFPYRNEAAGAHGVTIFANPFIPDKPDPDDPSVFAVAPGTLPPSDGPWQTLYFLPGIHKWSVDANGNEREWIITDVLKPANGKCYYIPGDAIVYGNINDLNDDQVSENIRVFGHGTLSGNKIPHFRDFAVPWPTDDNKELRMLHLSKAANCTYEGITIADQAEHGIYIQGPGDGVNHAANHIKWVKSINWRVNNDGGGVTGNGYVEDCFFRHQDDGLYVRGMAIRRTTFWSDVNGAPLRCDFIKSDRGADYPPGLPAELIVEDCDILYARGVFANSDSTTHGVITSPGGFAGGSYADGTPNTGQHIVFRNIRISDPRPNRYLLGFNANPGPPDTPLASDWAGLRFENINFQHAQTFGWRNRLLGSAAGNIRYWTFDNVSINGQALDAALFNDPAHFETSFTDNMIFR